MGQSLPKACGPCTQCNEWNNNKWDSTIKVDAMRLSELMSIERKEARFVCAPDDAVSMDVLALLPATLPSQHHTPKPNAPGRRAVHDADWPQAALVEQPPPPPQPPPYVPAEEDELDRHVADFVDENHEAYARCMISRRRPGVYELSSREVVLEWETLAGHDGFGGLAGRLLVLDGPLRQPLVDYVAMSEDNAAYDATPPPAPPRGAIHDITPEQRLSFGNMHLVRSRLEAMSVAMHQALLREAAAACVKEGKASPDELLKEYQQTAPELPAWALKAV